MSGELRLAEVRETDEGFEVNYIKAKASIDIVDEREGSGAWPTCRDWFGDVLAFHRLGCPELISHDLRIPSPEVLALKTKLLKEEIDEIEAAARAGNLVECVDGIIDEIYYLMGMAVSMGVDLRPAWAAVHKSNMAKVDGTFGETVRRDDGKVLKPPGWKHPDLTSIVYGGSSLIKE